MKLNYTIEQLDSMEGHKFEYAVADLLLHNGWRDVEVTKGSGDYGIDILARRGSTTYAIQCKRYNKAVSLRAVQEANSGADYYHCQAAAVITNNIFTQNAVNLANENGVRLYDRNDLILLINNYEEEYDEIYSRQRQNADSDSKFSTILPSASTMPQIYNTSISTFPKACPICGREFQSHSLTCPICKCELISNSQQKPKTSRPVNSVVPKEASQNHAISSIWTVENEKSYQKAQTTFLLCLFLGFLGIHRIYSKKFGTGILWLFTCGLFGIGWLIDLINLGIIWSNLATIKKKSKSKTISSRKET